MNKSYYHMIALLKSGCIALSVLIAGQVHAQEDLRDTIKLLDTLIDAPTVESYEEDTIIHFDKVIYTPKVQLREVPDSIVKSMKNDDDFWYANANLTKKKTPEAKEKEPMGMPFYRQTWFRTLLWTIIIGAFVAVVIWYLVASNVRLFRKAPASIVNANNEEEHNDIFSINYNEEINKAVNAKNHRLAIRLLYLQTLKLLASKGIIQYKAERTNSEYLWQLHGTKYYTDFSRLTRDFDYTWYGHFDVSEAAFQSIYSDFTNFKNRIK